MKQEIDLDKIKDILNNISSYADQIQESLDGINNVITSSIGESGLAWQGEAATTFRNSWENLSSNIGNIKEIVNTQVENVRQVLITMSKTN